MADGFSSGFSFDLMSAYAPMLWTSILVYDEVGGTGDVIGSLFLRMSTISAPLATTGDAVVTASYTPADAMSIDFQGVARSVKILAAPNSIILDNIAFEASPETGEILDSAGGATAAPEPGVATLILLGTVGLLGAGSARRRAA